MAEEPVYDESQAAGLERLLQGVYGVTQEMLAEYKRKKAALDAARDEFEAVAQEITEHLLCGDPVEPGRLAAEFDSRGNLRIIEPGG